MRLDCRVLDQDIHAAPIIFHLLDQRLHADLLGHIVQVGARLPAAGCDARGHFIHVDRGNVVQRHPRPARREGLGQGCARPLARARDQNHLICKFLLVHVCSIY